MKQLTQAAYDVILERERQQTAEGHTIKKDDDYPDGELAQAAAAYILQDLGVPALVSYTVSGFNGPLWPWAASWWKPKTRRQNLVRAAALTLAEIEKMDRAGRHD